MTDDDECFEGYVVDIACLRKYPREGLLQRAKVHTKRCAMMGHCVESGYGLVNDQGQIALLEPAATPMVLGAIDLSRQEAGIKLRVRRVLNDDEMRTREVQEM